MNRTTVLLSRSLSRGAPWLRSIWLALCASVVLAGCGSASTSANALDTAQYSWSGAIRWGDFGGARNLVDPEVRAANPMTQLEMDRYDQVQISSYRDVGGTINPKAGMAMRNIEIGVVNRHTMAQRTVRYREAWRWDAEAKTWWVTSGMPDLWDGQ